MAKILELFLLSRLFIDFFADESRLGQIWASLSIVLYLFVKIVLRKKINIFDKFIIVVLIAIIPALIFNENVFKETLIFTFKYLTPVMFGSMLMSESYKPSKFFLYFILVYLTTASIYILNVYSSVGFNIAYVNKYKNYLFLGQHAVSQALVKIGILYYFIGQYYAKIRFQNIILLWISILVLSLHVRSSILAILLILPFTIEINKRYKKLFNSIVLFSAVIFLWQLIIEIFFRFIQPEKLTLMEFSAGRTGIWQAHYNAMDSLNWIFGRGVTFIQKFSTNQFLNLSLHNDFLQIVFTYGIPVFIVFLYLFFNLFKNLGLSREQFICIVLPMVAMSVTNGMLFHQNTAILFFIMGFIIHKNNATKKIVNYKHKNYNFILKR